MTQTIKLIKKEEIANGTMAFYFEKPDGFLFRAGQNCDLTIQNPSKTDDRGNKRTFSLITTPTDDNIGFATRIGESAFKNVLKDFEEGNEVDLDGPYGDFKLHSTEEVPAVFLIGGIGVTPVISMVADATEKKSGHKMTLLHANKTPEDAPFTDDLQKLSGENENFTFVPVLDKASEDWKGEEGYINAEMVKKYVDDLSKPIYYLSGPAGMVGAMRKLLLEELAVNEDNIKTEEFPGY